MEKYAAFGALSHKGKIRQYKQKYFFEIKSNNIDFMESYSKKRITGKMQVGIYQEMEEMANYLNNKGILHQAVLEVGPFFSRLQAVEWMDYVANKHKEQSMECFSLGYMNKRPWYGCIFE